MNTQNLPATQSEAPPQSEAELIIVKISDVMKNLPGVLRENRAVMAKASSGMQKLIEQANAAATITKDLDDKVADAIVRGRARLEEMESARKPYTQLMSEAASIFTNAEGVLKPLITKLGEIRTRRVNEVRAEEKKREEEARLQRLKVEERATIEAFVFKTIGDLLSARLSARLVLLNSGFNSITLDNFAEKEAKLNAMTDSSFPVAKIDEVLVYILPTCRYHPDDERDTIARKIRDSYDLNTFYKKYELETGEHIRSLREQLPSKLAELQEADRLEKQRIRLAEEKKRADEEAENRRNEAAAAKREQDRLEALAAKEQDEKKKADLQKRQDELARQDAERKRQEAEAERQAGLQKAEEKQLKDEQDRLEQEKLDREKAEQERIDREQREREAQTSATATMHKTSSVAMSMFNEQAMANVKEDLGQVKEGFDILVTDMAGWAEIFQFWFMSEEAAKLWQQGAEKFENMTFERMKAYVEKAAIGLGSGKTKKAPETITSKYLQYVQTSKAITRKEKEKK